jgi:mannose-6-phosphate isomerase-like protein (cupin superfamily)
MQSGALMIERIVHENRELALIIRHSFRKTGVEFFTPGAYSQQLGYMNRPAGYVVSPHVHNAVNREVKYTNEVLFVRSGRVRVDLYTEAHEYLESTIIEEGDVILLAHGGHGLEMLEPTEIIEVKQGPYTGDQDKTFIEPVEIRELKMRLRD